MRLDAQQTPPWLQWRWHFSWCHPGCCLCHPGCCVHVQPVRSPGYCSAGALCRREMRDIVHGIGGQRIHPLSGTRVSSRQHHRQRGGRLLRDTPCTWHHAGACLLSNCCAPGNMRVRALHLLLPCLSASLSSPVPCSRPSQHFSFCCLAYMPGAIDKEDPLPAKWMPLAARSHPSAPAPSFLGTGRLWPRDQNTQCAHSRSSQQGARSVPACTHNEGGMQTSCVRACVHVCARALVF